MCYSDIAIACRRSGSIYILGVMKEWDADSALQALSQEATLTGASPEDIANQIFKDSLPVAAASIVHSAQFSTNEQTRLRAAQYVVERNLGRLQDTPQLVDDPFDKFLKEMQDAES